MSHGCPAWSYVVDQLNVLPDLVQEASMQTMGAHIRMC